MVRFGIIGTNFISREFVNAGKALPDFRVSAVYSRSLDTARAFAGDSGAVCLTSLDELAGRADVDAVYIASPNAFHAGQAEQMLRAGKHVLLEKPPARIGTRLRGCAALRGNRAWCCWRACARPLPPALSL